MRSWSCAFALLTLGLLASPARAVPLVSIEFEVVSGTFASSTGFAQGPITGGTIRWVADGGGVETPAAPQGRFTHFSLTGPSGFFAFEIPVPTNSGKIDASSIALFGFQGSLASAIRSGANATAAGLFPISSYVAPVVCAGAAQTFTGRCPIGSPFRGEARGSLASGSQAFPFGHSFIVGQEVVRTYLPEPGTGSLIALALCVVVALPVLWGAALRR